MDQRDERARERDRSADERDNAADASDRTQDALDLQREMSEVRDITALFAEATSDIDVEAIDEALGKIDWQAEVSGHLGD